MRSTPRLKDDALMDLSDDFNVAAFVSFRAGDSDVHHSCLPFGQNAIGAERSLEVLLALSRSRTVNVRSFSASQSKGMPFVYGLRSAAEVFATIRQRSSE